jgi:uncharacterized pyridoxal phosphate-containing UPF0001 family protein
MNKDELKKRLEKVKKNIKIAANKVDRDPSKIKLIAVSKNHFSKKIEYFREQGIKIFGENRVQELRKKNNKLDKNEN